jgi:lauroyl/myristoyl acyltransferase
VAHPAAGRPPRDADSRRLRPRVAASSSKASVPLQLANLLKYRGFSLGAFLVPRLPQPVSYGVALRVADLARQLTPGRRLAVAANLRRVLGPAASPLQIAKHTREVYRNIALYYVDFLRLPSLDPWQLERDRIVDVGYHFLLDALAEGRGVIVVTPHLGNPDLTVQAARARGLTFLIVTEPIEPPPLAALALRLRSSHGNRPMSAGIGAGKEAIRTLRRGGAVILVSDRDIQGGGVQASFFGAPARIPTGAVDLARITGAPIIPAFSRRLPNGMLELSVEARVELVWTGNRLADQRANVERILRRFEPHIRSDPGQWLVLEPIWPPNPGKAT